MSGHSIAGDSQRNSPMHKHSQREIPVLAEMPRPVMVPHDLISRCKNRLDAIRLCVQLASLSHETVCDKLGIDKGHWSRMMQGKAYFPDTKSIYLMELCGNCAPAQFEAWALGCQLMSRSEVEAASLRARLAELEGRQAA